ncbi:MULTISPECIES: alpha/beta fold hydrolase [unclassified Streptomyces]|uniref:alpha/beta fold hydrolase n=1 Tax=unclassified Streptomyces TaxID=2593676 RepID=UPI000DC776BA|nr:MULTISPECIES: alpha/beta fold hydrolase [unclassified Streptomyces]AWZ08503.1 alpha/beta hydrolase [Streptomyces sp. ICC4]AWZ16275.1 alpha/beta hydrolase [Streptomyces sp. ICC1]
MSTALNSTYARTVRKESGGPGLLLAHGGGGSVESNFGPILDALAVGHSVVGVDYPGTGGTPRATEPLELDELADQLVAAADAEGLERFAVLGYSLGGNVAARIAARHPERVTALVLTATFARSGRWLDLVAGLWSELARRGEGELLARLLVPLTLSPHALEALTTEQVEDVVRATAASFPPGGGDHAALVRGADVSADLARVDVPALVIATTADRLVPLELQRAVADALPGARWAELPTGHLPFVELPQEWAALVTEFLASA